MQREEEGRFQLPGTTSYLCARPLSRFRPRGIGPLHRCDTVITSDLCDRGASLSLSWEERVRAQRHGIGE
jgi:hypothetical protein